MLANRGGLFVLKNQYIVDAVRSACMGPAGTRAEHKGEDESAAERALHAELAAFFERTYAPEDVRRAQHAWHCLQGGDVAQLRLACTHLGHRLATGWGDVCGGGRRRKTDLCDNAPTAYS